MATATTMASPRRSPAARQDKGARSAPPPPERALSSGPDPQQ
jgi:hypothetical protein